MRRVKQKADIFQFGSLGKSFDLLLQRCNSLAHLKKETQKCTIKVYEMQGFEHINGLVFSREVIVQWKAEHTPLQVVLVTAPASSPSETPPAPHYSGGAAGFLPVNATCLAWVLCVALNSMYFTKKTVSPSLLKLSCMFHSLSVGSVGLLLLL